MARKNSYIHIHLTAAVALVLFFVAVPPLVSYLYKQYYFQPRIDKAERQLDSVQALILKDLLKLEAEPLFPETARRANTHAWLSGRTGWATADERPTEAKAMEAFLQQAQLTGANYTKFSKHELLMHFENYKKHFQSGGADWVAESHNFDHWSFVDTEEYRSHLKGVETKTSLQRVAIAATLPIPDYQLFKHYGVFFFLKQYSSGRAEEGLRGVHQLATLVQSSGGLVAHMIAIQLLQLELHLADAFEIHSESKVSADTLLAYRRVSWAWIGLFQLSFSRDRLKDFEKYMSPRNGVCSAVFEAPGGAEAVADFLAPEWPLEMNLQPHRELYRARIAELQEKCGGAALAAFSEPLPAKQWWSEDAKYFINVARDPAQSKSAQVGFNWGKLPYVRQMIGIALMGIAMPNYFGLYEALVNQKNANER